MGLYVAGGGELDIGGICRGAKTLIARSLLDRFVAKFP